jgi:glycosyltransferase involved in cell wall biosynthesis
MISSMKLKIAWLAQYPVESLAPALKLARTRKSHPSSWIVNLAQALAPRGEVDLHLITLSQCVNQSQIIRRGNLTFHIVRSAVPFTNRGYPVWFQWDVLTRFCGDVRRLRQVIDQIQPDLVHGHGTEGSHALAAVQSGYPHLVSIQGIIGEYYRTNPTFRFRLVRHYEADAVRRARFLTCRTEFDSGFVRAVNPQARIFMIPEAMSPVFFTDPWRVADQDVILFVGSPEPRKGLPFLLEAVAVVACKRPAIVLRIVGNQGGPAFDQCCQRARQLGIIDRLEFLGFQPAETIARLHRTAQVFVLPSQNENSPNALAEAMVSGMPVIATNVGGIPSMIEDGQTGLLVPWAQPAVLAEKILWLLDHPEERRQLGAQAREIARSRHLPEKVAEATVAAYQAILAEAECGQS